MDANGCHGSRVVEDVSLTPDRSGRCQFGKNCAIQLRSTISLLAPGTWFAVGQTMLKPRNMAPFEGKPAGGRSVSICLNEVIGPAVAENRGGWGQLLCESKGGQLVMGIKAWISTSNVTMAVL